MRVVILQDYLRVGGTERQTLEMARGLNAAGVDCVVVTARPGGPLTKREAGIPARVRVEPLQVWDTGIDEWMPGLETKLKKLAPDIVMAMGQVANLALPRVKKAGYKTVATVRTGKRLTRAMMAAYRMADLIITNTFALQATLLALGLGPVGVVPNALLMGARTDMGARMLLRRKMGADENTAVALCLQRLVPRKMQAYVMESFLCALEQVPNSQLWIVGRGPMEWPLRVWGRVLEPDKIKVITPTLPVWHYYNAADLAVTASAEDALPNFLIEAHAFGLPALCVNNAGCGEVVVGGITGLVAPPGDDLFFAASLQQLLATKSLREAFAENARRLTFRFAPHRQTEKLVELFKLIAPEGEK